MFLVDTDDINELQTSRAYLKIYKKFIATGAPFELNLPQELVRSIKNSVAENEFSIEHLLQARKHIVGIVEISNII